MSPSRDTDPLLGPPSPDDDQCISTEDYFGSNQRSHDGDTIVQVAGISQVANHDASTSSSPSSTITPLSTCSETEGPYEDYGASEAHPLLMEDLPPPYDDGNEPTYDEGHEDDGKNKHDIQLPMINMLGVSAQPVDDYLQLPRVCKDSSKQEYRSKNIQNLAAVLLGGVVTILLIFAGAYIIRSKTFCWTSSFVSGSYQIEKLNHFEFSDDRTQNSGLPRGFSGTIHVLSGPSDQVVDLNVSIRSTTSDLRKATPDGKWRPRKLSKCAEVALYFRPGLRVSTLTISSKKTDIVLLSDLVVTETTTISLKKGKLDSQNFTSSRRTYIDAQRSTISGAFGLQNQLSIKTKSSSLSIDILPQVSLDQQAEPALLDIESKSGAVHINYPPEHIDIPDRIYRSTITSHSGAITGQILHGQNTEIDVRSGSVNTYIIPYGSGAESSFLTTKSKSGSTKIVMLKPRHVSKNMHKRIVSNHIATSGHLSLRYPDEWEGKIHGWVNSGNFQLRGRDVQILTDEPRAGNRHIYARKGQLPVSKLKFQINSGSADVVIGSD